MEIIPAIDLIDGKCVRLTQGDYAQKKEYSSNPLEVAQRFADHGIRRLHLVDLDGAKQRTVVNLRVLEQIATHTALAVDFGGGVQSDEDLQRVLEAGAQQVTGGSIAVRQPEVFLGWLNQYGADKIILGADARDRLVAISGWQEASTLNVVDFIRDYAQQGVRHVICTDVAKDGLLQGPSFALYDEIIQQVPSVHLIASGGITTTDDLRQLKNNGLHGAIIGKALYEGTLSLTDLAEFL
ncbi:MAG: 1-(5-phosphoribosyl)-5-[(5-phosphoribosylamino)methylideneamino]imidazole-4-carboxamide isomerase [Tunicatimonas sp.]